MFDNRGIIVWKMIIAWVFYKAMSKVPTVKSHNELTNQLINQILSNGAELFYHVGKIQIR